MLRICCQAFISLCKSSGLCKLANSPILGALSWQKPLLDVNALFFVALGWVKMFWKGLLEGLKFTQVFVVFFLRGHLPCTVTIIPYSSTHHRQLSFMNISISWGIWCCLVQLIFSPALPWLICAWLKFKCTLLTTNSQNIPLQHPHLVVVLLPDVFHCWLLLWDTQKIE